MRKRDNPHILRDLKLINRRNIIDYKNKKMLEPLTKIIAYTFTFMILAVGICAGVVLYIDHNAPSNHSKLAIQTGPDLPLKPQFNEQQLLGQNLFKANCASCHKPNKRAVGPALAGVSSKYDRDWIYSWIEDPQAKIASGDADAIKIYNEYNQTNMNAFPQLSHDEIDAILAYADYYL